jgi:hypothetical protein
MPEHQQPEGMSRQAVCILMGALAGFALAVRVILDDYGTAGKVPWATALAFILGGCVAGFVVGILFVGTGTTRGNPTPPPAPPPRPEPPPQVAPDSRIKPAHDVEGIRAPEDRVQEG